MASLTQIPRHLLPQIPKNKIDEFCKFVEENGIKIQRSKRPTSWFLPIQKHINQEKVDHIVQHPDIIDASPVIATSEGYLVDGHHRWVAARKIDHPEMDVIICECNLRDFLKLAHQFDHSYVKSVHELTTYGRLALFLDSYTTPTGYSGMIRLSQLLTEATKQISPEQGQRLYSALGLDSTKVDPDQFLLGLNTELDGVENVNGSVKKLVLLVLAHLKQQPDYYTQFSQQPQDELPAPQVPPQY